MAVQEPDLSPKDVIRHYDVTGKACPKYFVDREDAWKQFRKDVKRQCGRIYQMRDDSPPSSGGEEQISISGGAGLPI